MPDHPNGNPFDSGSVSDKRKRGLKSLERRGKLLAAMGALMATWAAAEMTQAATQVLQDGEGMRRAKKAAENGDCATFIDALIGEDHGKQSIYSQLRPIDPFFAMTFRSTTVLGLNALTKGQAEFDQDLANHDDSFARPRKSWWDW